MTKPQRICWTTLLAIAVGYIGVLGCADRTTTVPEYVTALSTSATVLDIGQGASDAVTVTFERDPGYMGEVALRVEEAPSELTVQLDRASLRANESQAQLTVIAPTNTPVARYTFRVRALAQNGSSRVSTITVNVKRVGFRLALGAGFTSIPQRESVSLPITISRDLGYVVPTTLTVSGVPTDVSARFTTQTLLPGADRSDLILTPGLETLPGSYTVTVRANALASPEQTATFQLTVTPSTRPDFALGVGPSVLTVYPDSSVRANVVVTRSGGFSGTVTLRVTNLPVGITPVIDPPVLGAGQGAAAIEFRVARDVPYLLYFPIVSATADGLPVRADSLTLRVRPTPNFTIGVSPLTSPGVVLRFLGATRQLLAINIVREGGYARDITLVIEGLPPGVRYPVPTAAGLASSVSAALDVDATARVGSYPVTIRARGDDGVTSATTFTLVIAVPPS